MELLKDNNIRFVTITEDNVESYGFTCIKNRKNEGFGRKMEWYSRHGSSKVRIIVALDEKDKHLGFVEYMPGEEVWRPVLAQGYYFIQCLATMSKKDRSSGIASQLIDLVYKKASEEEKNGVCTMTSKGVWLPDKSLFEKNGYQQIAYSDRFELMVKKTDPTIEDPAFLDWEKEQSRFRGWHLLYADQCPWHIKSVDDLSSLAKKEKIELNIKRIESPEEAQKGPSGFGTFALLKDGKLLSDHYLSASRFRNIIKEEAK